MGAGAIGGHKKERSSYHQEAFCSESSSSFATLESKENNSARAESSHSTLKTSFTDSTQISSKKSAMKMSCEMCLSNFTIFKRKKFCQECHRYFCSTCLPKPPATKARTGRQCSKCQLLMSGQFSRTDLQDWKVKDMRCFLAVRKVSMIGCTEKHDLIELVLAQFCTKQRNSLQDQQEHEILVQAMAARMQSDDIISATDEHNDTTSPTMAEETQQQSKSSAQQDSSSANQEVPSQNAESSNQDSNEESGIRNEQWQELFDSMERIQELFSRHTFHEETSSASDTNTTSSPGRRRCHIDDIHTEEEIDSLSVKQIKELLVNNFVDFKGCCEKQEVIERVKRLWRDHQVNKSKAEKIHQRDEAEAAARSDPTSEASPPFTAAATTESDKVFDDESTSPMPDIPSAMEIPEHKTRPADLMQQSDSLCRVCMDVLSDCILLECGHMVTCTTCGKQLAECPICRQYIVRVVRVFRS